MTLSENSQHRYKTNAVGQYHLERRQRDIKSSKTNLDHKFRLLNETLLKVTLLSIRTVESGNMTN